jgi:hypothetical protein
MTLAPADHEVGSASRHYPVRGNGSHRNGGRHSLLKENGKEVFTQAIMQHKCHHFWQWYLKMVELFSMILHHSEI